MKMKRSYRSPSGPKSADDVDRHVGHRIRAQRMLLGMSQSNVADRLDLTFQQIQKYERGVNRVGAGRLSQIGDILRVPVTYFYEGAPATADAAPKKKEAAGEFGVSRIAQFLATKQGLLLATTFLQIKNESIQRRLLALMIALAGGQPAEKVLRSRVGIGRKGNAAGPAPAD
jgi:transcriptional regulator with XRE-family HTH domain